MERIKRVQRGIEQGGGGRVAAKHRLGAWRCASTRCIGTKRKLCVLGRRCCGRQQPCDGEKVFFHRGRFRSGYPCKARLGRVLSFSKLLCRAARFQGQFPAFSRFFSGGAVGKTPAEIGKHKLRPGFDTAMGKIPSKTVFFPIRRITGPCNFKFMHTIASPRYIAVFLIATIIVITGMLGVLMTLLFMNQKRHLTYQASILALKSEHAQDLLRSQIEIQELTFKIIAQEIHDNINLSLTLAKLTLHQITELAAVKGLAENAQQLITGAINDLSAISRGLNADIIHQQGLFNALKAEIDRIERVSQLRIDFRIEGETEFLSAPEELLLFRSVQECLNNVLKHAQARQASLLLCYGNGRVRMEIRDDGKGFTQQEVAEKRGRSTGLHTLRSRVELLAGTFDVQSKPGEGTHLILELPISDPHEKEQNDPDRLGGRSHPAS
ncbi:MAG: sensor histidine kinase [Chitinophagaceae bacterium]|nr:MAG: sensor histidine kinase [Chitinophagaceae bacterium]